MLYLKKKVKSQGEKIARLYRQLFLKLSLPDFMIIGAQKCGTSSLYSYLVQHPGIIAAEIKEINYFGHPSERARGKSWYASHFCTIAEKESLQDRLGYTPITGEATPHMNKPLVPKFVHEMLPSVKLIALLRNPVDRAFSHYHHNRQFPGKEPLTFKDAIEEAPHILPDDVMKDEWLYYNYDYRSYITRGFYDEQLERWYEYFPKKNILVINSEIFFANPASELKKVLQFLNMPDYKFDVSLARNIGDYESKIDNDLNHYLVSTFRPHNRKLFQLIEQDYGWPS